MEGLEAKLNKVPHWVWWIVGIIITFVLWRLASSHTAAPINQSIPQQATTGGGVTSSGITQQQLDAAIAGNQQAWEAGLSQEGTQIGALTSGQQQLSSNVGSLSDTIRALQDTISHFSSGGAGYSGGNGGLGGFGGGGNPSNPFNLTGSGGGGGGVAGGGLPAVLAAGEIANADQRNAAYKALGIQTGPNTPAAGAVQAFGWNAPAGYLPHSPSAPILDANNNPIPGSWGHAYDTTPGYGPNWQNNIWGNSWTNSWPIPGGYNPAPFQPTSYGQPPLTTNTGQGWIPTVVQPPSYEPVNTGGGGNQTQQAVLVGAGSRAGSIVGQGFTGYNWVR